MSILITPSEQFDDTIACFPRESSQRGGQFVSDKPVKQPSRTVWALILVAAFAMCTVAVQLDNLGAL